MGNSFSTKYNLSTNTTITPAPKILFTSAGSGGTISDLLGFGDCFAKGKSTTTTIKDDEIFGLEINGTGVEGLLRINKNQFSIQIDSKTNLINIGETTNTYIKTSDSKQYQMYITTPSSGIPPPQNTYIINIV